LIQENFENQHQILFPWICCIISGPLILLFRFLNFVHSICILNHFGKQTTPIKKSLLFSEFCNVVSKSPFGIFRNVLRLEPYERHFDIMNSDEI